jgi:hypothetical protein
MLTATLLSMQEADGNIVKQVSGHVDLQGKQLSQTVKIDIPVMYCDKEGTEKFVVLGDVQTNESSTSIFLVWQRCSWKAISWKATGIRLKRLCLTLWFTQEMEHFTVKDSQEAFQWRRDSKSCCARWRKGLKGCKENPQSLLEPLMEGTYVMYPYLEFHKYRELVSRLVWTSQIPVTHSFHMFPPWSNLARLLAGWGKIILPFFPV